MTVPPSLTRPDVTVMQARSEYPWPTFVVALQYVVAAWAGAASTATDMPMLARLMVANMRRRITCSSVSWVTELGAGTAGHRPGLGAEQQRQPPEKLRARW